MYIRKLATTIYYFALCIFVNQSNTKIIVFVSLAENKSMKISSQCNINLSDYIEF